MSPAELLDAMWRDYVAITPAAARIHALLEDRGETVFNDHVALRTFGAPAIGLEVLARPFERLGWAPRDRYRFADKHLRARWWQHPDPALPKIFISELVIAELSPAARARIAGLLAQVPAGFDARLDLSRAARPWTADRATYQALLAESEYAAWLAAFGLRVNHFTIDVGRLATFDGLAAVCAFLAGHGLALSDAGGLIKGTPADRLEQASTRADEVEVAFADGPARVPSCYYELARRYPVPSGELFQGFVPASADRLFESTDVRRG
jgi:2-oxoadipate dioxygenase/decarboxylase